MARTRRWLVATTAGGLAVMAALSACSASGSRDSGSGSGAPGASGGAATVTEITVGTSPALSNVGLYYANEAGGLFEKAGLHAKPQVVTSGAQAVPLLLNGQLQFTAADPLGAMLAIKNGTPLVMVASGNTAGKDPKTDNTGLLVKADSGISGAKDLNGKTVAINSLNGLAAVGTKEAIAKGGGDPNSVKFVEVPIPQMQAAVDEGTVDGAVTTEPFLSSALGAGQKNVLAVLAAALPGVPQIVYVTSADYAKSNPEQVSAFAKSIAQANKVLADDDQLKIKVATTSTQVPADVLSKVILPQFDPPTIDIGVLEQLQKLMVKYGVLQETFDPSKYIFGG